MKRSLLLILLLLPLPAAPAADNIAVILDRYQEYKKDFPRVPAVTVEELAGWIEKNRLVILVDVREPEEQRVSMIPGAMTVPEFEKHKDHYRDAKIVTYCTIGSRSGAYAKAIQKDNNRVYNLMGSILMWAHQGLPLINEKGLTKKVHVYGPDWNLLPDDYEAVW